MTPQLWIGFGFLTTLVVFLIVVFFVKPKLEPDQRKILKFLTSLCAGMAGGFLCGEALVKWSNTTPTATFALSGTAGFALFFVVWFFYPTDENVEGVEFGIPANVTFRQTLDIAAKLGGGITVDYQVLKAAELSSKMVDGHISCQTLVELFSILRLRTQKPGAVRDYKVTKNGSIYRFEI